MLALEGELSLHPKQPKPRTWQEQAGASACQGQVTMPLRPCLDCGRLSDQSRCPPCRGTRNRQRDQQRGGTTARSYGTQHQARRTELLPSAYGQPCARCLELMLPGQDLDLDHSNPADKLAGEPGDRITHAACNRGGRKSSDV